MRQSLYTAQMVSEHYTKHGNSSHYSVPSFELQSAEMLDPSLVGGEDRNVYHYRSIEYIVL